MTIVILSGIIIGLLLVIEGLRRRLMTSMRLSNQMNRQWVEEYNALEQGRNEESESYEQMFLSQNEQIYEQSMTIGSYVEDQHFLVTYAERLIDNFNRYDSNELMEPISDEDRDRFCAIKAQMLFVDEVSKG